MSLFICKTNYFILNRRTITWTSSLDHTGIQRGTIQVRANNIMGSLIGVSQPAGFLLNLHVLRVCRKGKRHHSFVTELFFHFAVINGISCNSGRCSGLETEHFDSKLLQGIGQIICRLKSIGACIIAYITVNTSCLQVSSGTQNNCLTVVNCARISLHSGDFPILNKKLGYFSLADSQVLLILQSLSHFVAVCLLVGLGAKGVDSRTLGTVQHFGLNEGLVNIFSHFAAQGIQFTYQMALRAAPYIGIAGHQCNTLCTDCKHNGIEPQSCACKCCLTACMTCTNHYNVIIFFQCFHDQSPRIIYTSIIFPYRIY